MLVSGKGADEVVAGVKDVSGVSRVLYDNQTDSTGFLAETMTPVIVKSQEQFEFSHIFAGATAVGKNILPRVAAKLDVGMISEVTAIESEDTFVRTIYAGNAIQKVKSTDGVKVVSVRGLTSTPPRPRAARPKRPRSTVHRGRNSRAGRARRLPRQTGRR